MPTPDTEFAISTEIGDVPDLGVVIDIKDPMVVHIRIDRLK